MSYIPPQTEAIRLYCGSCEDDWNGLPVEVGPFACVSPVYGKTLATKSPNYVRLSPKTIAVIQDSGAFCEGVGQRLSFEAALRRQIEHAERFGYADRVTHRASYDQLIDDTNLRSHVQFRFGLCGSFDQGESCTSECRLV